ncbi:hypothetical protein Tco_0105087 [Tanacetum coccineum]
MRMMRIAVEIDGGGGRRSTQVLAYPVVVGFTSMPVAELRITFRAIYMYQHGCSEVLTDCLLYLPRPRSPTISMVLSHLQIPFPLSPPSPVIDSTTPWSYFVHWAIDAATIRMRLEAAATPIHYH